MMLFWTLAGGVITLAFIAIPLLRNPPLAQTATVDQDHMNLEVFRQRLKELETDLSSGLLDQDQYESARRDLERELLAELKGNESLSVPARRPWVLALALTALLPLASIFAYLQTGRPDLITGLPDLGSTPLAELIARLEHRLNQEPDHLEGWLMLGRTYLAIDQPAAAVKAMERAYALAPQSVEVLLAYAEALGLADPNKSLLGRPAELIAAALALEPKSADARWFSGLVAFQRGQYQSALNLWQGILDGLEPGSEEAQNIKQMMDEARRRAGMPVTSDSGPPQSVSNGPAAGARLIIRVSLDPKLADRVLPDDTVFVFARATVGPPMPLAVQRLRVKDLPATVTLDDSQAMNPGLQLSAFESYRVGARVSRSGEATPRPGDLFGESGPVQRGSEPLELKIDQVRP